MDPTAFIRESMPFCAMLGVRAVRALGAVGRLHLGRAGLAIQSWAMAWDVLTEEQREIRELVRTLARERVAPRAAAIDESHEFPWDVVELFREHELFGLLFDEEWGGSGTGTLLALV